MKLMPSIKSFKNKKLVVLLSCVLILSLCLTGVLAYLTDGDFARNKFIVGGNRIEIEEGFIPPPELKPGVSFTKNVRVKNTGSSDCYVRVMAVFTTSDMEKYCEVDWNTTDWVFNEEDGYWYYPKSISTGDKTPSLFTKVKIKEFYDFDGNGTTEEDETVPQSVIEDFDIIVYAESYQSGEFFGYENAYQDAWAHYRVNKPG